MAHLWLQVLPRAAFSEANDPRRVLQEALARHNVEKKSGGLEAHYNLAAMLQARGELAEAMKQYGLALRLRPEDATANNAFAAANMAAGHPEAAIKYLEAALRSRPDYFDAHYNLGTALAMRRTSREPWSIFALPCGSIQKTPIGSKPGRGAGRNRALEGSASAFGTSPGDRPQQYSGA